MMVIGIIGGGQLARMLALAGIPLGLRFVFLDPNRDACAAPLGEHLRGDYDDPERLAELAAKSDVITYEFENVPVTALAALCAETPVFPPQAALHTARDRWREKTLFRELAIPVTPFARVDSLADLCRAAADMGLPAILKTRTLGYDGKGQFVLRSADDIDAAWEQLGGRPLILEKFVDFDREVSIIGVRGRDGDTRFYPLAENEHQQGILRYSRSLIDDPLQEPAEQLARHIMDKLDYVGVMALELFVSGDRLVANEIAPRVHNSGHWTIEGAVCSQFANHLRAILGIPLGSTDATGYALMINFIGEIPPDKALMSRPGLHLHHYNKAPYPGRKVGHATIWARHKADLEQELEG